MSLVTVQTSVEQFLRSQLCEDCDENQHFIQFSTIFLFFILFRHKPLFSAVTFSNIFGKDCRYYFSEHIFKIKSNKSWDFYLKSEKVLPPPAHLNKMHILSPVPSLIERTQFQSGPVEAHLLQEVEGKIKIKDFTFLFAFLLCPNEFRQTEKNEQY